MATVLLCIALAGAVDPKIRTENGGIEINGADIKINTDACPDRPFDVCQIEDSISQTQSSVSSLAANTTAELSLVASNAEEADTAIQESLDDISSTLLEATTSLASEAQSTAISQGELHSGISQQLSSIQNSLDLLNTHLNISRCQTDNGGFDACGFRHTCIAGAFVPVDPDTCECNGQHDYGSGADGNFDVPSLAYAQYGSSYPNSNPDVNAERYFGAVRINAPRSGMRALTAYQSVPSGFLASGDEIVVIHLGSRGSNPNNIEDMFNSANSHYGRYEFHRVASISGATINLQGAINASFYNVGSGYGVSMHRVYAQKVPNFNNVVLPQNSVLYPGDRSSNIENGRAKTGMIFMRVKNEFRMETNSRIDATGRGYRRGYRSSTNYCRVAYTGEGPNYNYPANENPGSVPDGMVVNGGGGHGGDLNGSWCQNRAWTHGPMGGGGGSHLTVGQTGIGMQTNSGSRGYGDAKFRTFFLGSGGGGATSYRHNSGRGYGGYGGDGGGAIMIFANKVTIANTAEIRANGNNGANRYIHGGSGGGGAGGSISLQCGSECHFSGNNFQVNGGQWGSSYYAGARGGRGSNGRLRVTSAIGRKICMNTPSSNWACSSFANKTAYCSDL